MSLNIKPLGDKVIIRRSAMEEKSAGGIILSESDKELQSHGIVLAVGSGNFESKTGQRVPVDVEVGQKVYFHKHGGNQVKFNGETLLILTENEIYFIEVE